jgi:hypothetical protein
MTFGYLDTQYIDLPPGLSNDYLRGLATRSGMSVAEMMRLADAALNDVNTGVDPVLARLLAPRTTEASVAASRGDRMLPIERSEYDTPRPQYITQRAHMLAIKGFDMAIGATEDGLEEISRDAFVDNLRGMVDGWKALFRRQVLLRHFDASEVPIDRNQTATSPGYAGSGAGTNQFVGTMPDGTVINPATYTHYIRDTTANRAVAIKAARNLIKKWYPGPYELIGSQTAVDAIVALGTAGGFIAAGSPLIRLGDATAEALVDATQFVGVFDGDIMVRQALVDISGDYATVFKSFGEFNRNNPLVVRYNSIKGPNAILRSREMFPLANAIIKWDFGVNVNNRVAAADILFAASGNYLTPTII